MPTAVNLKAGIKSLKKAQRAGMSDRSLRNHCSLPTCTTLGYKKTNNIERKELTRLNNPEHRLRRTLRTYELGWLSWYRRSKACNHIRIINSPSESNPPRHFQISSLSSVNTYFSAALPMYCYSFDCSVHCEILSVDAGGVVAEKLVYDNIV